MSRKSINPENAIVILNDIKTAFNMRGLPFKREALVETLKNKGLPSTHAFFMLLKEFRIIEEIERGKYMFANKEPIYIGVLQSICKKYRELNNERYKKAKKPKTEIVVTEVEPENEIQHAINLLKENGYAVLAPIGVLYKQL